MSSFANANNTSIYGGVFNNHIQVIEEENDVLLWINVLKTHIALGAFHNSAERFDPPKCHPHTREAILKRIMQWVDDPSNQAQIMWIFGPAGAGKSAIAQSIADLCFQSDNLAAGFFFSRHSAGRDNAVQFITTLAYQLSCSIPEMKVAVMKALKDDPLLLSHSLHAQAHGLIIRPLNNAFAMMGDKKIFKFRPRLVIIDGLDECGKPKDQRYLLEVLSTITKQLLYPLLFFVASRPEQAIRDAFNKEPLRILTTRLALDDTYEADSDIRIFLQSKFDEIKQNHPAGGDLPEPWPSREELGRLVEKSSGQFIHASTVVKFVDSSHHLPQDRLDIVFGLAPPEVATPFTELDALYHQIFSSVVYIKNALEILMVLILFKDLPPRPALLDIFLSYKPGTTRMTLSDLHSILRLPPAKEKEGEIKIMHASLSDFLLDADRSRNFFVGVDAGVNVITRCILKSVLKKDDPRILIERCYLALPVFGAQTISPGPELMDDLFSFDLSQYVAWYKTRGFLIDGVETAATFFIWMKLKFHPDYARDLFHQHVQAIDAWILDQIEELMPHTPTMITTSISFLPFPKLYRRMDRDRMLTDPDKLMTISELRRSHVDTHYPRTELFLHSKMTGSPAFDLLLREFMAEPTRSNQQYQLDGEKCARLARSLWIYLLPYEVSKTFKFKKFGRRYSAKTTFCTVRDEIWRESDTDWISGEEPAMILLLKILPKVTEASVDTLDEFLQVVQDHPLLKYVDPADRMYYDLYQAAAAASEKFLGPELFERLGERRALREAEALRLAAETVVQVEPTVELRQDAPSTDAQQAHFNVPQSLLPEKPPTLRARFGRLVS